MESRTATFHRGFVPWQGLLLTASLLTFWSPSTTAQPAIESVPYNVLEGGNVLLRLYNVTVQPSGYKWYSGVTSTLNKMIVAYSRATNESTTGDAYSGRETIYPNGSLLIQNVTQDDPTFYTIQLILDNGVTQELSGEFRVYSRVSQPTIEASSTNVKEGSSVDLKCLSNDPEITISWIFKSQSLKLTDRMKVNAEGNTLTINPVKTEDAGEYKCEVSNGVSSSLSDPFTLSVTASSDKPAKPDTTPTKASTVPTIAIMILALAVLILICALAYTMVFSKSGGAQPEGEGEVKPTEPAEAEPGPEAEPEE
ncbi:carcinoembryonic antigen-related cell adhesion molecule 21-like isoform X2 [Cavia porcellus]